MIVNNIKYINDPKPGGKYGSIKTAQGITIMVPPDLLPGFRLGMSCEISTKQQTWGQGTADERLVTIATSGPTQGNTGAVQGGYEGREYQGASQERPAQRANTGFQPRVVQGGGGRLPDQFDPAKDLHIFVTGVVQQAMNSGKFTASEIPVLTQAAIEAYDRLLDRVRGKPAPAARPGGDLSPVDHTPWPSAPDDPGPELQ